MNDSATPSQAPRDTTVRSYGELVRRDFFANRLAAFGTAIIFGVVLVAVFCPFIANQRPLYIRAAFPFDYLNSLQVAIEQIDLMREGTPDAKAVAIVSGRFDEMRHQLDAAHRAELDRIAAEMVGGAGDRNVLARVAAELEPFFEVAPQPVGRYPAIRALGSGDVLALLLFAGIALVQLLRCRVHSLGLRLLLAVLFALIGTVLWKSVYPTVHDMRPYRRMIEAKDFAESGGHVVMPPIAYGENENIITEARQAPTWLLDETQRTTGQHWHWLGTDTNGRDVLARMIYGARVSMLIGIVAVSIYTIIGIAIGAICGYFGGWIDIIVSRVIEMVICFPALMLILSVQAFLAPSLFNIILALAALWWTGVARLQRGEFLRLVNLDYVHAIRALGGSSWRIIFFHLLPNGLGPILVLTSFGIAGSILIESGLSFLGFGVPQPMASWGDLLNNGRNDVRGLWWLTIFPGVAIFLTVTCFNLVGEGIRDALDPMRER